jgi:hypothetical protein
MIEKAYFKTPAFLLFFALALLAPRASAQTADELDRLLEVKEVNAAQAARFALGAAGLVPEGLSGADAEEAAYQAAQQRGWINREPGAAINLKEAAFLVMRAFQMKGGILYSIFHTPRYAYREMVYRRLIQGSIDPGQRVSGNLLLYIIGRIADYTGEDKEMDAALGLEVEPEQAAPQDELEMMGLRR